MRNKFVHTTVLRFVLLFVAIASIGFGIYESMPTAAHAATSSIHTSRATHPHTTQTASATQSIASIPKQPCNHLWVHLQGNKPPITKCLDNKIHANQPYTVSDTCNDFSLVLYWDANLSGATLCLSGSGWVNLTNFCAPWYLGGCLNNWNDKVSSFASHDTPGSFYRDINLQDRMFSFPVFIQGNLVGSANDTISSLAVQSCDPNDNLGETADSFISRCLRGSIRREFPSELLGWTLGQIFACAAKGNKTCQKARKLLTDSRFRK